jgi:hypothetical protein
MPQPDPARFLARARREAARYGGDPLVFLRELVQNARDAGATAVAIDVEADPRGCRLRCRDDGAGMTEAHARAYLFRLYASSKGQVGEAGRFGVGFWSVLRFEPDRLVVRSRAAGQAAWGIAMDGALSRIEAAPPGPGFTAGTEVVLERAAPWPGLAAAVRAALREQVRDVRRRDRPRERLAIRVDGEDVNAPLALPAPAARFEAGTERGAVGLAAAPRVDVFSLGLRVRSARTLEELTGGPAPRTWCAVPGLAPAFALESARVAPLLSRAELRADAALRRLERRGRQALRRLVDAELARLHPPRFFERLAAPLRRWPGAATFALTLAAGVALVALFAPPPEPASAPGDVAAAAPDTRPPVAAEVPRAVARGEAPLSPRLGEAREPGLNVLHGDEPALALRYEPASEAPLLAVRRTTAGELLGAAAPPAFAPILADDDDAPARWRVRVRVAPGTDGLPLPTLAGSRPTRIEPRPVRLLARAGAPVEAVFAAGFAGWVSYELAPAADPPPAARASGLPPRLAEAARALRGLAADERPAAARAFVQANLREARDAASARRFAQAPGPDFASRALTAGVGDCDVLNGVLALLLDGADVPARLAVGVAGHDGRALPGLHAWAEYHADGEWRALDATLPAAPVIADARVEGTPPAAVPTPTTATVDAPAGALPRPAAVAGLALAALLAAAVALRARARRSEVRTGDTTLDDLVRGALRHPEAFAGAPAVFDRPLLARAGGGGVSLGAAWREAAEGRLYRSRAPERLLCREARSRGGIVLDGGVPVAVAVADALGALDLDGWEERWQVSRPHPLLARLAAACREAGLAFDARLGPGDRVDVLPFAARGPRPRVLLGSGSAAWTPVAALPPARAAFELARVLLPALGAPGPLAQSALRALAREALHEALG